MGIRNNRKCMLGLRSDFLKKGKVALKVQQFGLWRGGEAWRDCLCGEWREEYLYSPTRKALVLQICPRRLLGPGVSAQH